MVKTLSIGRSESRKFASKWTGPHCILRILEHDGEGKAVEILDSDSFKVRRISFGHVKAYANPQPTCSDDPLILPGAILAEHLGGRQTHAELASSSSPQEQVQSSIQGLRLDQPLAIGWETQNSRQTSRVTGQGQLQSPQNGLRLIDSHVGDVNSPSRCLECESSEPRGSNGQCPPGTLDSSQAERNNNSATTIEPPPENTCHSNSDTPAIDQTTENPFNLFSPHPLDLVESPQAPTPSTLSCASPKYVTEESPGKPERPGIGEKPLHHQPDGQQLAGEPGEPRTRELPPTSEQPR